MFDIPEANRLHRSFGGVLTEVGVHHCSHDINRFIAGMAQLLIPVGRMLCCGFYPSPGFCPMKLPECILRGIISGPSAQGMSYAALTGIPPGPTARRRSDGSPPCPHTKNRLSLC